MSFITICQGAVFLFREKKREIEGRVRKEKKKSNFRSGQLTRPQFELRRKNHKHHFKRKTDVEQFAMTQRRMVSVAVV